MHGAEHLLEIFYLLLAAQVMAFIFKRLNQPVVIGEVLAGVLVGPALLGLVHEGRSWSFWRSSGPSSSSSWWAWRPGLRTSWRWGRRPFWWPFWGWPCPS